MQTYSSSFASTSTYQTEVHYQVPERSVQDQLAATTAKVPEQSLKYPLSPTIEKILQLSPSLVLGEANLFVYDSKKQAIVLSPTFQELLKLLVELKELDGRALTTTSLTELNAILQQPQGRGGLMRPPGTEVWDLSDNPTKEQNCQAIDALLQTLGFIFSKSIDSEITVDHCIIFGATIQRMEMRIRQTLDYLQEKLTVKGHIFLLGGIRPLNEDEIKYFHSMLENLGEDRKKHWREKLEMPGECIEANAFVLLWECIAPPKMIEKYIGINSTAIGSSYNGGEGHRPTTEVTVNDWLQYYNVNEPQAIFALAEQPYIRLLDQFRFTVLSDNKKATKIKDLVKRIEATTFFFVAPPVPSSSSKISVKLDEVARYVYRVLEALEKYFKELKSEG